MFFYPSRPYIKGCANPSWNGDGYCDDEHNILACGFDGGDCCGSDVDTRYCLECKCLEKEELFFPDLGARMFPAFEDMPVFSYDPTNKKPALESAAPEPSYIPPPDTDNAPVPASVHVEPVAPEPSYVPAPETVYAPALTPVHVVPAAPEPSQHSGQFTALDRDLNHPEPSHDELAFDPHGNDTNCFDVSTYTFPEWMPILKNCCTTIFSKHADKKSTQVFP